MGKNYFTDFNIIDGKLVELLEDHQLIRKFNTDSYPITLTITPNTSPEAQMTMYSMAEDGASSRDAKLVFSFPVGEIGIRIVGRLIMSDALMNKIKGLAKKMHYLYLQAQFAMLNEQGVAFPRVAPIEDEEDEPEDCEHAAADVGGDPDADEFGEFFDDEETEDGAEE